MTVSVNNSTRHDQLSRYLEITSSVFWDEQTKESSVFVALHGPQSDEEEAFSPWSSEEAGFLKLCPSPLCSGLHLNLSMNQSIDRLIFKSRLQTASSVQLTAQNSSFTVIYRENNTFKKLQPANLWCFCWKKMPETLKNSCQLTSFRLTNWLIVAAVSLIICKVFHSL